MNLMTLAVLLAVVTGCGNNGNNVENHIDTTNTQVLPQCLDTNNSNGHLIKSSGTVNKQEEETTLQIWHFDNGDKVVCVTQGTATFVEK